jgi:hypothetical protein
VTAELDPAVVREWVARTRAAKGLGPKVTDPAALQRIATLAFTGTEDDDAPARRPRRRTDHPAAVTRGRVRSDDSA